MTADAHFKDEWLANVAEVLDGLKTGLSYHSAHGAGSFRQYRGFCGSISGSEDRCQRHGFQYGKTVLRHRLC